MSSVYAKSTNAERPAGLERIDDALQQLELLPDAAAPSRVDIGVAEVFDLLHGILAAQSVGTACRVLADGLKAWTNCAVVAVATVRGDKCRVRAVSLVDQVARHSEQAARYEAVCRRALLRSADRHAETELAFRADGYLCVLLRGDADRCIAICLLEGFDESAAADDRIERLAAAAAFLGPTLGTRCDALQGAGRRRLSRRIGTLLKSNRRTAWGVGAALTALLLWPVPYQVRCDCELQPVVRRHVVAPFDGVLEKSLCKPGDTVAAGQVLGRLDAKELTSELAAVTADRDRAVKSRDINFTSGKTAAAQVDRFEALRLEEKRKLLADRLANLEVKSPIAGVVVAGDLSRVEGAPVEIGQSLYEVAPLDEMLVEIFVPEADVDRLHEGQVVAVSLDSFLGTNLHGTLTRIHPRSEIVNDANVFVAEMTVAAEDARLRPGMKGRAAVRTDRRPLAWVALHRVWETMYRALW